MYIIFFKATGIIVDKAQTAKRIEQGIETESCIYADTNLELDFREVQSVPDDLVGHKYKYLAEGGVKGEGGIVPNPDYVEYKTPEQELAELKARQAATEEAVLQLILSQQPIV